MRFFLIIFISLIIGCLTLPVQGGEITVGSKKFTESVILGEIAKHLLESQGVQVKHQAELGGTRILFNALKNGEIDIYPEYTGTIRQEIFSNLTINNDGDIPPILAGLGIGITAPLGFNNTYALGLKPQTAEDYSLTDISSLRDYPDLRFGFTNEFMDRGDGWPSLRSFYGLPQENVTGLDHDIAYRALEAGQIDLIDVYTTDAEIAYYKLRLLPDDLGYFPVYNAVYLYRLELEEKYPALIADLRSLSGRFSESEISALNAKVKIGKIPETEAAVKFLNDKLGINTKAANETVLSTMWKRTVEHMLLTGIALALGIIVALPLGITAYKVPRLEKMILGMVGVIQTIPALALLVLMIPLLGIAAPPAIAALFLYSLLPMVRNTHAGLKNISQPVLESARALGLSSAFRMSKIELPLAAPAILAGIKTSAVITVGFATLGALIGAGGYGQPILTGIRLDDFKLIMQGAVPAGVMALSVEALFNFIEKIIVPSGLKINNNV